jgi:hypothetical protein
VVADTQLVGVNDEYPLWTFVVWSEKRTVLYRIAWKSCRLNLDLKDSGPRCLTRCNKPCT